VKIRVAPVLADFLNATENPLWMFRCAVENQLVGDGLAVEAEEGSILAKSVERSGLKGVSAFSAWVAIKALTERFRRSKGRVKTIQTRMKQDLSILLKGKKNDVQRVWDRVESVVKAKEKPFLFSEDHNLNDIIKVAPWLSVEDFSRGKKLRLGGKTWWVVRVSQSADSLSAVLYGLLRRTVISGEIERIGICQECSKVTVYQTKKKRFCSDECRWHHHNKAARSV